LSKQTIYNLYRSAGLSHCGALAMLGNADCESGCCSYRKQGDFSAGFEKSKEYTRMVDTGAIDPWGFYYDAIGYGLLQWTFWSRKKGLLEKAKATGVSVGDEKMQVAYSLDELRNEYNGLLDYLKVTDSLQIAVSRVCKEYERPAINNIEARYQAALRIEREIKAGGDEPTPKTEYWPPRMIDKGMSGPDVGLWQSILKARGYALNYVSEKFDDLTAAETKKFQSDHGLTADSVVGPLTWKEGLKY